VRVVNVWLGFSVARGRAASSGGKGGSGKFRRPQKDNRGVARGIVDTREDNTLPVGTKCEATLTLGLGTDWISHARAGASASVTQQRFANPEQ